MRSWHWVVPAAVASAVLGQESRRAVELPATGGVGILRTRGAVFAVELERTGFQERLRGVELGADLRPKASSAAVVLWEGRAMGPVVPQESFALAERGDGGWAHCGYFQTGAGRALRFWTSSSSDLSPARLGSVVEVKFVEAALMETDSDMDARTIASTSVPDERRLDDLWDPQPFEWRGRMHVVGCGRGRARGGRREDGVVWIAAAPKEERVSPPRGEEIVGRPESLVVRRLAEGVDPRVVAAGDDVVVALRKASETDLREAPLSFLRSRDLKRWVVDASLSTGAVATPGYALLHDRGRFWTAAVKTSPAGRSVGLSVFDPAGERWIERSSSHIGAAADPSSAVRPIALWILPSGGETDPIVVLKDVDGALRRLRP
jgi:hypothetical protein